MCNKAYIIMSTICGACVYHVCPFSVYPFIRNNFINLLNSTLFFTASGLVSVSGGVLYFLKHFRHKIEKLWPFSRVWPSAHFDQKKCITFKFFIRQNWRFYPSISSLSLFFFGPYSPLPPALQLSIFSPAKRIVFKR